jgi:sugar lactone lactonase YvrE
MRGGRRLAILGGLAAMVGGQVVGFQTAARAATPDVVVTPPLTAFTDMVVGGPGNRVFLAGGGSNGVVVRAADGASVATIANESGATSLALSADGSRLFVALRTLNAISVIDTTSLAEVSRISTGSSTCPTSLAVASAKVWFGYGCASTGNIGVLDMTGPTVSLGLLSPSPFLTPPALRSSAAKPDLLVAGELQTSPGSLWLVDITSGSPVLTTSKALQGQLRDLSLSLDGTQVVAAQDAGLDWQSHPSFSTTDLAPGPVYGTNDEGKAVALTTAGVVAAGYESVYLSNDLLIQRADATLIRTYDFGSASTTSSILASRGLAFSPDGSVLYAVTTASNGGLVSLRLLHDVDKYRSQIYLFQGGINDPTTGSELTLNGSFSPGGGGNNDGVTLSVQRDSAYGTVALPDVVTQAGQFHVKDTVTQRGNYGYTATWVGDSTHTGTSTRIAVYVKGLTPVLTIPTSTGPYAYGARPTITAHLGTTKVRTLTLYSQACCTGSQQVLKTGTVDAGGNLAGPYTLTRNTGFKAVFKGDDTYEPRTVTAVLRTRARVVAAWAGYYSTSGSYRLFHKGVVPTLKVAVVPSNVGQGITFDAQYYSTGTWKRLTTVAPAYLDATSRAVVKLKASLPVGTRFRMRAKYSETAQNAFTVGSFVYGRVTS